MILCDNKGVRVVSRNHVDAELTGLLVKINTIDYRVSLSTNGLTWLFERLDGVPGYAVSPDTCTCDDTKFGGPAKRVQECCKHRTAARKLTLAKLLPLRRRMP